MSRFSLPSFLWDNPYTRWAQSRAHLDAMRVIEPLWDFECDCRVCARARITL
jgi:hypothetical protein